MLLIGAGASCVLEEAASQMLKDLSGARYKHVAFLCDGVITLSRIG